MGHSITTMVYASHSFVIFWQNQTNSAFRAYPLAMLVFWASQGVRRHNTELSDVLGGGVSVPSFYVFLQTEFRYPLSRKLFCAILRIFAKNLAHWLTLHLQLHERLVCLSNESFLCLVIGCFAAPRFKHQF